MTKISFIIITIIIVSHYFHIYLLTEITTLKVKGMQYVPASGTKLASSSSLNDIGSQYFRFSHTFL